MPFISLNAGRELTEFYTPDENLPDPTFGETFAAGVGSVFDEESSISHKLNREAWLRRRDYVEAKIDAGEIDPDKYQNWTIGSAYNYDKLAADLQDPNIKTDAELKEQRNEELRKRRLYSTDILERGNGAAGFLGKGAGYMTDPISIGTMPIATISTAARGLSILGRSLLVARNAALIEGATEIGIQAFVYNHKNDISSPYNFKDALVNISMAAGGGAVIGGASQGISGYLRKAIDLGKQAQLDKDGKAALVMLERFADSLPEREKLHPSIPAAQERMLADEAADILKENKIAAVDLGKSIKEIEQTGETYAKFISKRGGLNRAAFKAEGIDPEVFKGKHRPASQRLFPRDGGLTPDALSEQLNELDGGTRTANDMVDLVDDITSGRDRLVNADARAELRAYKSQLERLESLYTVEDAGVFYKEASMNDLEFESRYIESVEEARREINGGKSFVDEPDFPREKAPKAETGNRQRAILADQGLADEYDDAMKAFDSIDSPKAFIDEEMIDPSVMLKDIDDELAGLESVLVCAYG